jgi:hypothetical protein
MMIYNSLPIHTGFLLGNVSGELRSLCCTSCSLDFSLRGDKLKINLETWRQINGFSKLWRFLAAKGGVRSRQQEQCRDKLCATEANALDPAFTI